MHRNSRHLFLYSFTLAVAMAGLNASAQDNKYLRAKGAPAPQEQIEVVAHIPAGSAVITRLDTVEQNRRNYIYAEHETGQELTLVDVTQPDRPALLLGEQRLLAMNGDAALVTAPQSALPAAAPPTFRIVNFTDPHHVTVKQEFTGVTAMTKDDNRGLIFLANPQGVWILRERYAADPAFVKQWEHMMLDSR
jgi:hypothetical protein